MWNRFKAWFGTWFRILVLKPAEWASKNLSGSNDASYGRSLSLLSFCALCCLQMLIFKKAELLTQYPAAKELTFNTQKYLAILAGLGYVASKIGDILLKAVEGWLERRSKANSEVKSEAKSEESES